MDQQAGARMTSSAKTLRALERAAMRWYRWWGIHVAGVPISATLRPLYRACARHAAALKRKRTGRR
jgi:hypothetical protein